MTEKDFKETAKEISLHGLGFIQVKLPGNMRLHVWDPALPRRDCFRFSGIHNHRFSFRSTVVKGVQLNQRIELELSGETHDFISHDGPRSATGGRISYVSGQTGIKPQPVERYIAGESYIMDELEYHQTPNSGVVVTLMEKLSEGEIHAHSITKAGVGFDYEFDRFQLTDDQLWAVVRSALEG